MTEKGWTQVSLMDATKEKLEKINKIIQEENPFVIGNNKTIMYLIQFFEDNSNKHSGKVKESSPLSDNR